MLTPGHLGTIYFVYAAAPSSSNKDLRLTTCSALLSLNVINLVAVMYQVCHIYVSDPNYSYNSLSQIFGALPGITAVCVHIHLKCVESYL